MVDEVATALSMHTPVNDEERLSHRRMGDLLTSPGDPFSRSHLDPGHFTASTLVLGRAGLLLIHHAKLDRWLQPGGHVDAEDASLFAASLRELREETGVVDVAGDGMVFDLDVHPIPANSRKGEPPHEHFDVRFLVRTTTAPIVALAASDALAVKWVPLTADSPTLVEAVGTRVLKKLMNATKPRT